MKSNDNIPQDEMLLAEALAAAKGSDKKWCSGVPFANEYGERTSAECAHAVCALGALHLAGRLDASKSLLSPLPGLRNVINGNDTAGSWLGADEDLGESLGWAFRCAMTQEEP